MISRYCDKFSSLTEKPDLSLNEKKNLSLNSVITSSALLELIRYSGETQILKFILLR